MHRTSSTNFQSLKNESHNNITDSLKSSKPKVSQIRSLLIKSDASELASNSRLNHLFTDLEHLEQLRLFNIKLDFNDTLIVRKLSLNSSQSEFKFEHLNPSEVLNFGQKFPNLKLLRLQSFITKPINGLLSEILKELSNLEYLEIDSNNLSLTNETFSKSKNSLKKLYLYNNNIRRLDSNVFSDLNKLEILDISRNGLTRLPSTIFKDLINLQHLSIKGNSLKKLPDNLLQTNAQLESFDISLNRNLTELPIKLFFGLNQLSNLNAKDSQLTLLNQSPSSSIFSYASNLQDIELRGNKLKNLTSSGLFNNNHVLKKLDFSYNEIAIISSDIFNSNSSQITELNLYGNELELLPNSLFSNLKNLKILNLGFNKLKEIHSQLFLPLKSLEEINLSKNNLITINSKQSTIPFGLGPNLKRINLSQNNLTDFDSEFNSINWSLYIQITEINLQANQFAGVLRVPIFSSSNAQTVNLDLSYNKFHSVDVSNLKTYDELALSSDKDGYEKGNKLDSIQTWETNVQVNNNLFNCDCFLEPFLNYAKSTKRSLRKSMKTAHRQTVFLIDEHWDVNCNQPENMKNVSLNSIDYTQLLCNINDVKICPNSCDCSYRSSDGVAIVNCENRMIHSIDDWHFQFNNISLSSNTFVQKLNGIILKLNYNSIGNITNLKGIFSKGSTYSPNFAEFHFDYNNITNLPEDWFKFKENFIHTKVNVLSLKFNQLKKISIGFLDHFFKFVSKVDNRKEETNSQRNILFLEGNPFNCTMDKRNHLKECEIIQFKTWLTSHHDLIGDINSIKCSSDYRSNNSLIEIPNDILCPFQQNDGPLLFLSILCIILAICLFVVSLLYYLNKQTILAFIYIHFNPIFICLSFNEDDLDEDKIYDAFVSYSSADRHIVMELIEKLEKPNQETNYIFQQTTGASIHEGFSDQIVPENEFKKSQMSLSINNPQVENDINLEQYYKLCVHERDWLPGNLISWNIINSVKNSKRTILILSKDFIKSIWFQVEFHTAYYQMLEDKIDRLIVIVKGELPPKEELDKDLVFLLTTKTYLVWGEKWFWEKLRYALPHKKQKPQNYKHYQSTATSPVLNISQPKNFANNKSSEMMKDYVDKTIANHFQLERTKPNSQPKSLRNSVSNKENVNKSKLKNGHDNRAFFIETPT